jgi:hypothetical protein
LGQAASGISENQKLFGVRLGKGRARWGGYVKPANLKEKRVDRRFAVNQNGKRKVVVIVRECGGDSVPALFHSRSQASAFIRSRIAKGTVVHATGAGLWDNLHEHFEVKRSTIEKRTRSMARARIGRKSTSAASAALKSASTITLRALIFSATRKNRHGGKITAAYPMGIR